MTLVGLASAGFQGRSGDRIMLSLLSGTIPHVFDRQTGARVKEKTTPDCYEKTASGEGLQGNVGLD
jgi:hypothetical protein